MSSTTPECWPPSSLALPKPASPSQTLIDRAALTAKRFVDQLVSTTQDARAILIEWVLYIRNKAKVIVVDVANEGNAFTDLPSAK